MSIFQEANRSGKIRPEWVYSFQTTPHSDPSLHVPVLCQFRKERCFCTHFDTFPEFHQLWYLFTLRITATVEFHHRRKSRICFFKLLCCQECQKPNAIHIFLKSIQCSNCSEIPGFSASKVCWLRPWQYLNPFRTRIEASCRFHCCWC